MSYETAQRDDALQLEALLFAREYLYTMFAKLLGGTPNAELLDCLLGPTMQDAVEEYADDDETMRGLLAFLRELGEADRENLLDQVKDEYTRVLIGPGALPASPYESPYTGAHDESLFQENTLVVRRCYHAAGLRAKREMAVPDDHVALMCAFMAFQARASRPALRNGDAPKLATQLREQSAFAERHLGEWLGIYATAVRNSKAGSRAVLYPQMLEALAAFAKCDAVFLKEAAFWAEGCESMQPVPEPSELAAASEGLERLRALRLFGLEDNELVSSRD